MQILFDPVDTCPVEAIENELRCSHGEVVIEAGEVLPIAQQRGNLAVA